MASASEWHLPSRALSCSSFSESRRLPPWKHVSSSGVTPASSSAAPVTILKMLAAGNTARVASPRNPGCACECSAMASTRPVEGSSTTTAP